MGISVALAWLALPSHHPVVPSVFPAVQCKVAFPLAGGPTDSSGLTLSQTLLPNTQWHASVLHSLVPQMREVQVRAQGLKAGLFGRGGALSSLCAQPASRHR